MSSYKAIILIVSIDKNILLFETEDGTLPHQKVFIYPMCL